MSEAERHQKSYLREAAVIFAAVLGCFVYISLLSFSPEDSEANLGGRVGWQIARAGLWMFGYSAYLVIAMLVVAIWLQLSLLQRKDTDLSMHISSAFGLLLLIFSTCALESLRFYGNTENLPEQESGGFIGFHLAKVVYDLLGFHGASLILIGAWFSSVSLFVMISWISAVDMLGKLLGLSWAGGKFLHGKVAEAKAKAAEGRPERPHRVARPAPKRKVQKNVEPILAKVTPPPKKTEAPAKPEKPAPPRPSGKSAGASKYKSPSASLLSQAAQRVKSMSDEELRKLAQTIESKLEEFGVIATVEEILPGPVVTRYEIQPASGVKGSQVVNLVRDLSRALSVSSIRVLETIPNKTTMGLEVPNAERSVVGLHELVNSTEYQTSSSPLALALGRDIAGNVFTANLDEMPHLLVAGTTGSGKSVQINSMILSILYRASPDQVRLILIDPKVVEMAPYDGLPHLLAPVINDMEMVPSVLSWCVAEMERRYQLMARLGVRNLSGLNETVAKNPNDPESGEPLEPMPLIVVIVDELADLMAVSGKKVEQLISRLAQKARAAGIHLILATQRPSVDVITGLIKANVPSRIAFQVSSRIDSRTILDQSGAETLLGKGDMLYLPGGQPQPHRVHGAFVSDEEVRAVTDEIRASGVETEKIDFSPAVMPEFGGGGESEDPLMVKAVELVTSSGRVSISRVQRHLRIGYNRAANLVEAMERAGIVSPMDSSGNRKLLTGPEASVE